MSYLEFVIELMPFWQGMNSFFSSFNTFSYYSLPKEPTILSETQMTANNNEVLPNDEAADDSHEEMYPNNSEDFHLLSLVSTSEWGQRNETKRKRED